VQIGTSAKNESARSADLKEFMLFFSVLLRRAEHDEENCIKYDKRGSPCVDLSELAII
jgi:hypothetical protein